MKIGLRQILQKKRWGVSAPTVNGGRIILMPRFVHRKHAQEEAVKDSGKNTWAQAQRAGYRVLKVSLPHSDIYDR